MTEVTEPDLIAETLEALGVERIIIVDDDVDALHAEAALIRVLTGIREARTVLAELAAQNPDLDLLDFRSELTEDDDELRQLVARTWINFSDDEQARIIAFTPEIETEAAASTALAQIRDYLPAGFDFEPRAAGTWGPESYRQLADDKKPTLVFFDKNLTNAKLGEDGGERLLKDLLAQQLPDVFCGLLTQEVPSLVEESRESSRLGSVSSPAVPVLGKFRLKTAQQFALGMQAFILAHDLHLVRRHVLASAESAMEDAIRTTGALAYVTLLASARSAYGEGLYEGAGVGRMLFTRIRRNVESALMTDVPRESIDRIRRVMTTKLDLGHPDPAEVGLVQDAFESAEHLNSTLSPTEVGDIYEFSAESGKSFYILLAQPCDLMVRSRGTRDNNDGYFVLARLMPEQEVPKPDDDSDPEYHHAPRTLSVGQIPDQTGNWKINLADRAFMPPELLDACVLNPDGTSTIPTAVANDAIPTIAWSKWRTKVDKWGVNKVDQARQASRRFPGKALTPEQKQQVVDLVVKGDLGRQFVDGKVSIVATVDPEDKGRRHHLVAGIRRVGRLSAPHATALLIQFSHFHTRPDLPVALLKMLDPPETIPTAGKPTTAPS